MNLTPFHGQHTIPSVNSSNAPVAQRIERQPSKLAVTGSSPVRGIEDQKHLVFKRGVFSSIVS